MKGKAAGEGKLESVWPERDRLWRHLWTRPRGTRDGNSGSRMEGDGAETPGHREGILCCHPEIPVFTPRGIPGKILDTAEARPRFRCSRQLPPFPNPRWAPLPVSPSCNPKSSDLGWVSSLLQALLGEARIGIPPKPAPGARDLLPGKSNPAKGEIQGVPDLGRPRAGAASQSPG